MSGTSFAIELHVRIRPCREEDLPALEWMGLLASHRGLMRRVWEQQVRGEALMLVAEVNGEVSGQLWADLARHAPGRVAEVWAVRVLPCLQGKGLGAHMLAECERQLRDAGFESVRLAVETENPRARRFYEREGYGLAGTELAADPPELPDGRRRTQWVLEKKLRPP